MIRLATWNINSLKVRMPRVEQWLAEVEPDIVCLQETKVADDAFPALTFASMGYESAHHGQGQWNGVAMLSKVGLDDVVPNFAPGIDPDVDARIITATCAGIRVSSVYVPNGRSLDHEHYVYKLDWLDRLGSHVASGSRYRWRGRWSPATSTSLPTTATSTTPPSSSAPRTSANLSGRGCGELADRGLVDVFRRHYDGGGVYSWWDYRAGDFHEGRGMRIDLILATESVARTRRVVRDRPQRPQGQARRAITPPCWSTCATDRRSSTRAMPGYRRLRREHPHPGQLAPARRPTPGRCSAIALSIADEQSSSGRIPAARAASIAPGTELVVELEPGCGARVDRRRARPAVARHAPRSGRTWRSAGSACVGSRRDGHTTSRSAHRSHGSARRTTSAPPRRVRPRSSPNGSAPARSRRR